MAVPAYQRIQDNEIDAGSPITQSLMTRYRNNLLAVMGIDIAATEVKTGSLKILHKLRWAGEVTGPGIGTATVDCGNEATVADRSQRWALCELQHGEIFLGYDDGGANFATWKAAIVDIEPIYDIDNDFTHLRLHVIQRQRRHSGIPIGIGTLPTGDQAYDVPASNTWTDIVRFGNSPTWAAILQGRINWSGGNACPLELRVQADASNNAFSQVDIWGAYKAMVVA